MSNRKNAGDIMKNIIVSLLHIIIFLSITGHNLSAFAAIFQVSNASQLQSALQEAQNNYQDDLIRLAQGTYTGNFIYASHAAEDLTIEGGWQGSFTKREIKAENTILDGNQTGGVFVFSCDKEVSLAIDAITFQNGSADEQHGGGIFISNIGYEWHGMSSITISNNIIKNNSSIGVMHPYGGGAGIYIWTYSPVIITDNVISGNSVNEETRCGGVSLTSESEIDIIGNAITGNKATWGGGMCIDSGYKQVRVLNNIFSNNEGIFYSQNNSYGNGGGLYALISAFDKPAIISGNIFSGNKSGQYGGGLFLEAYGDKVALVNNQFTKNQANKSGGGISIWAHGHEVQLIDFINNTVAENNAGDRGGGLDILMFYDGDIVNMYNNIFWHNSSTNPGYDMYIDNDFDDNYLAGTCNLYNNNFSQSGWGIFLDIPFSINSSNLNGKDPLFAAAWQDNYLLSTRSPCSNRGNNNAPSLPSSDLLGNPRVQDGVVDMGAYEGAQIYKPQPIFPPLMLLLR
jgi:hypothetical protein